MHARPATSVDGAAVVAAAAEGLAFAASKGAESAKAYRRERK